MRNPKRIPEVLGALAELWKKHPDYRFGQLLINYSIVPDNFNVWNNKDDGFLKYLYEIIKNEDETKREQDSEETN